MPFTASPLPFVSTTASRETVVAVLRNDDLLATLADHTPTLLAKFAHDAVVGFPGNMPLQLLLHQIATLGENAARVRNGFLSFHSDWLTKRTASEAIVSGLTERFTNFLSVALRFLADGSDVTAVEVVDAVYHIYDLFLTTHIAPSSLFNSPPSSQSTPMRTNSAAHTSTRTTHSVIDPKLLYELQDHLWVVDNDSFFDHFFPHSFDHVTLPPPFPTDQSEANVVKWIKDYHPNVGNANPSSPSWCWGSSGQRPLIDHCTNANRKMDLFTHSRGCKHEWSNVGVVSELKYRSMGNSTGDFNNDLLVQLAGYARCVFAVQPGRRFVHGFTLICARMRCWVFTRSGGVASPNICLDTRDGLQRWRQVALSYLYSDDIGQAPRAGRHVEVSSLNLRLESRRPFFWTPAIVTRGTTCWHVSADDYPGPFGYPFVLKESWRSSDKPSEGELLERANEAGVQGIAVHLAHYDYEETVHTILGPCREPSRVLDLNSNSRRSTPLSSRLTSRDASCPKPGASCAATPLEAGHEQSHSAERAEAIIIPDRIRTLVVMSRGRPITKFADAFELLRSFRDAIRGHHSLLTTGGILHRDVSINNIMMTHPSYPRQDGFFGFLIDLDLAVPVDSSGLPLGASHRTGTYEFISIENLRAEPGFVHTFHDDLQSFFFVFLWLCYQRPDNPSPATPDLVELWGSTTIIAANAKVTLVLDEWEFGRMLAGFKTLTGTEALQNAARKARDALWPRTRPGGPFISREELQQVQVRETVYQEFLAAFETGDR